MVSVTTGLDALNMLNDNGGNGEHKNKFTSFKSGDKRIVKVINYGDFIGVQTYSIFKKVNTFVPEQMPKLSANGFPVDNYTPFDKAWKYHKDQSTDFQDEHSKAASQFRIKPRFAIGFYDLDTKECIVIDFSKAQAKDIIGVITKNEKKLGKKAFELEKSGTGTATKITLTPLDEEDLTVDQAAAFEAAPKEFDKSLFDNLYFVQNEEQMVESLRTAGFNTSLIGYDMVTTGAPQPATTAEVTDDPTAQF